MGEEVNRITMKSCARTGATVRMGSCKTVRMNTDTIFLTTRIMSVLAQASSGGGDLAQGASQALGIVMLIGFIFGIICVIGGGFAIRRGDADTGKLSIVGGLIIAGAPVIVKALFTAFGLGGSTVDIGSFH